jgi:succinylglutamic semialdehyde dehydrogenase
MKTSKGLFINNQWLEGQGGMFASHNPATGDMVWEGASSSENDVEKAVKAASTAFESWALSPLDERISYLHSFAYQLKRVQGSLSESISRETGKPLWESQSEVASMIAKVDISVEAYRTRCKDLSRDLPHAHSHTRHKPHGPVGVLGPFNFPGHLPNGHIVPALLAGNTVVFKPSEFAPQISIEMVHCWEEAGLPPGVINLIQGGKEVGALVARHAALRGLFFTGSWQAGKQFLQDSAQQPQKVLALEMGGNNPLVISHIKDLHAAAYITIQSAFITAGQRCSCARRLILVEHKTNQRFLHLLIGMMKKIMVGAYTQDPEPFMGPVISATVAQHLLQAQETLLSHGGVSLMNMRLLRPRTGLLTPGLLDVTDVIDRSDEELFGPFLQVIRVPDLATALKEANNTQYGLSAGLLSDHIQEYRAFYNTVQAGVINWNTPLTGASSSAPFGGLGQSGNYRPSAFYAADYCSYPVASLEVEKLQMPSSSPFGLDLTDEEKS